MIKRIQLYFLLLLFIISPQLAQASDSTRVFTQTHPLVYEDAWDLWPYSFLNANGEDLGKSGNTFSTSTASLKGSKLAEAVGKSLFNKNYTFTFDESGKIQ